MMSVFHLTVVSCLIHTRIRHVSTNISRHLHDHSFGGHNQFKRHFTKNVRNGFSESFCFTGYYILVNFGRIELVLYIIHSCYFMVILTFDAWLLYKYIYHYSFHGGKGFQFRAPHCVKFAPQCRAAGCNF